jgi:methionine-rich copper-binding protein CopC
MGAAPSAWPRRGVAACGVLAAALLLSPGGAGSHAFLKRSDPRAGTTLSGAPARVRVWFDGPIEPVFSTIRVENRDRQRVDRGDGRVSQGDPSLLEVALPALSPGRYRVVWSVIARDGHREEGDFGFRVQ